MELIKQIKTINQQIKELVGIYREAALHSGISENEYWIWYALIVMKEDCSQQNICGMWSLSKQTVNTIITNMVKKGYVQLESIHGAKNRKLIRLTETGMRYGKSIILPVVNSEQAAFEKLPAEELNACINTLGNYITLLKEEMTENDTI